MSIRNAEPVPIEEIEEAWRQGLNWTQVARAVGLSSGVYARQRLTRHYRKRYDQAHGMMPHPLRDTTDPRWQAYRDDRSQWIEETLTRMHDPTAWVVCLACGGSGRERCA